jgi:hypothetical protein
MGMRGGYVKVFVDYEDGNTWLEPYTREHIDAGLAYAEMRADEWAAYKTYRVQARLWGRLIRELDEQQYERAIEMKKEREKENA